MAPPWSQAPPSSRNTWIRPPPGRRPSTPPRHRFPSHMQSRKACQLAEENQGTPPTTGRTGRPPPRSEATTDPTPARPRPADRHVPPPDLAPDPRSRHPDSHPERSAGSVPPPNSAADRERPQRRRSGWNRRRSPATPGHEPTHHCLPPRRSPTPGSTRSSFASKTSSSSGTSAVDTPSLIPTRAVTAPRAAPADTSRLGPHDSTGTCGIPDMKQFSNRRTDCQGN